MVLAGSIPRSAPQAGRDATRAAQRASVAKMVGYYLAILRFVYFDLLFRI